MLLRCASRVVKGWSHARQGMADARATISGFVEALTDSEQAAAARSTFREKYPDSFWVDFGALRSKHDAMFELGVM